MKYIFTLFTFVFCILPSFAEGSKALTLSRVLIEDMSQKNLVLFNAKYLVGDGCLSYQLQNTFVPTTSRFEYPVQGQTGANEKIINLSNALLRAVATSPFIGQIGGYVDSFSQNTKKFAQKTGFSYSDMAVMLGHSLENPTTRNFSGYFVKDFSELQQVALHPTTGQTLNEALRTAYQQAQDGKGGILIVTEEAPAQVSSQVESKIYRNSAKYRYAETPRLLQDMYVLDWENGRWISYKESLKAYPLAQRALVHPCGENAYLVATKNWWKKRNNKEMFIINKDSYKGRQIEYALQNGYIVHLGVDPEDENTFVLLFSKEPTSPLTDNVYDL